MKNSKNIALAHSCGLKGMATSTTGDVFSTSGPILAISAIGRGFLAAKSMLALSIIGGCSSTSSSMLARTGGGVMRLVFHSSTILSSIARNSGVTPPPTQVFFRAPTRSTPFCCALTRLSSILGLPLGVTKIGLLDGLLFDACGSFWRNWRENCLCMKQFIRINPHIC